MRRFSQRTGLKPTKTKMQVGSMDQELRNRLWNALAIYYWSQMKYRISENEDMSVLFTSLWHEFFKLSLDTLSDTWISAYKTMRELFSQAQWFEVYDLIEFVADRFPDPSVNKEFVEKCNSILKEDLAGYRFVGGRIVQITSEEEIIEVEQALKVADPLGPVRSHLQRALELFSDKRAPDYRNSIKESISAVEAMCRLVTGDTNATLGQGLKLLEDKGVQLHGALKNAFSSIYGYTSSAQGIRHGLLEQPSLDFEDAKFMMVSCSAFINYLVSKCSKAGIKL